MALDDYRYALEFRQMLQKLVSDEVEKQRPRYQMATVTSIDRVLRRCTVRRPADTTDLTVSMGSIQPSSIGQLVRIEGLSGDRYIADVMGEAYQPLEDRAATFNQGIILPVGEDISGTGWDQMRIVQRSQALLTGSGNREVLVGSISWVGRLIAIAVGQGNDLWPGGYLEMTMPPDGTVITGVGMSNVTVAGGYIPFTSWNALYYIPQMGAAGTPTIMANYRMVAYNTSGPIPSSWICVALRNSDGSFVRWGDGRLQGYWRTPSLLNGWVNYGSTFDNARYKAEGGRVEIQGVVKTGTISATSTGNIFVLPTGSRPSGELIFDVQSNSALGRIDVYPDGSVRAQAGSNAWINMTGISFPAEV